MENNSILPGIIVLIVIIMLVTRSKRNETRPKSASERGFVEDVIATIQRTAPDFDGAQVFFSSDLDKGKGCVSFKSLRGQSFEYNYAVHGYNVSEGMAITLASEIAKHFESEYRRIRGWDNHGTIGYEVVSPRQLAAEQEKKRREDSLKRL